MTQGNTQRKTQAKRLEEKDETSDFGSLRNYFWELFLNWFSTIDALFGLLIYSLVTLLFSLIALVYWPVHTIATKIVAPLLRHWRSDKKNDVLGIPTQSLGPLDDIFQSVLDRYTNNLEVEQLFTELQRPPAQRRYSTVVCRFLLVASALAYQRRRKVNQTVNALEEALDATISVARAGTFGATILILKIERNNRKPDDKPIVITAFKGTSPLDATEWFKDFSIRKTAAPYNVLPGLIHSGFFYSLGWPQIKQEKGSDSWAQLNRAIADMVPESQVAEHTAHLWVAGHSLGGATSCLFNSILLWRKHAGWAKSNPAYDPTWADRCVLHGVYTFGQPRVGDSGYKVVLNRLYDEEQVLHIRVSNNLDIVPHVPPGDRDILKWGRSVAQILTSWADNSSSSQSGDQKYEGECEPFNHLGVSTIDFEHIGTTVHLQERPHHNKWGALSFLASFLLVWDHSPREYMRDLNYWSEKGLEKDVVDGGDKIAAQMAFDSKFVVSAVKHCTVVRE